MPSSSLSLLGLVEVPTPSPRLGWFCDLNPNCNLRLTPWSTRLDTKKYNLDTWHRHGSVISFCSTTSDSATTAAPLVKKRKRYRKLYPGESQGIVEEMRFVAMKLRNDKTSINNDQQQDGDEEEDDADDNEEQQTWWPTVEGFLNYLVDSKLVFQTLERIVDESDDVAYAYFRNTGLERSESLSKDLEWLQQQDLVIPQPSNPGVSYAEYLDQLASKSAPMFLCHLYNIYFAHISGGQVITDRVSQKLLEGAKLEFCKWEGDELELLKDVRDKLNKLGEHWPRDDKNKCLRETAKSFRFLGQIVRLIIL